MKRLIKCVILGVLLIFLAFATLVVLTLRTTPRPPPQSVEEVGPVNCVAVSQDGQRIASGHYDQMRVWDLNTGALLDQVGDERPAIACVAFSPDGKQVAYAHFEGHIRIWDLELHRHTKTIRTYGRSIGLGYSHSGKQIVMAGTDRAIRFWDADTGLLTTSMLGHEADVNSFALFSDGSKLISAGGDFWSGGINDPSLRLWDCGTGTDLGKELKKFDGSSGPIRNVVLTPDNRTAVTCHWRGIQVWDVNAGTELRRFGRDHTNCIALSPDGQRVVSGDENGDVCLWSVATGHPLQRLPGHSSEVHGIAFCPDGIHAVSCAGRFGPSGVIQRNGLLAYDVPKAIDCTIRLWDTTTGQEVRRFNAPMVP